METFGFPEDEAIEHGLVSRAIEQAQSKIEGHHFDARKYVLEFDNVMNKHRETIYRLRREIVSANSKERITNNKEQIFRYIEEVIDELVKIHTQGPEWNLKEIEETIKAVTGHEFLISNYSNYSNKEDLKIKVLEFIEQKYSEKEKQVGEAMRQLEKFVLLRVIDELWVDHLEAMDYLRSSVNLRAYGQRDPLVEYRIEGQKMFEQLLKSIKYQVVNLIFKVGLQTRTDAETTRINAENVPRQSASSPQESAKVGRNDPCWCGAKNLDGSPKKFKKCHGK